MGSNRNKINHWAAKETKSTIGGTVMMTIQWLLCDRRQKKTIYACSRPTSKLLITLYDVWCGMFNKLSMTLPPWQSRVPLMPQTKRYIHPSRDHTGCASSSHELGPGDACLSLACSSIAISSAMAFFFVATYTKHRMFMFLDRSFYCIQDLIALQIANIQLLNITYKQWLINSKYITYITLSYVVFCLKDRG
jgi:hypothetical protein